MDPSLYGIAPGTTGAVDPSSAWPVAGSTGVAEGSGVGQHGITPIIGGGGSVSDAVNSIWGWLNTPFTQPMNPVTIFWIVGTILIAIIAWNLLLYHIRIAAETI
jgi:hypothetical protein